MYIIQASRKGDATATIPDCDPADMEAVISWLDSVGSTGAISKKYSGRFTIYSYVVGTNFYTGAQTEKYIIDFNKPPNHVNLLSSCRYIIDGNNGNVTEELLQLHLPIFKWTGYTGATIINRLYGLGGNQLKKEFNLMATEARVLLAHG
jgi:hypothetical protein